MSIQCQAVAFFFSLDLSRKFVDMLYNVLYNAFIKDTVLRQEKGGIALKRVIRGKLLQ